MEKRDKYFVSNCLSEQTDKLIQMRRTRKLFCSIGSEILSDIKICHKTSNPVIKSGPLHHNCCEMFLANICTLSVKFC